MPTGSRPRKSAALATSDEQALAFLRKLEGTDATLSAAEAALAELAAEVERVRLHAAEVDEFLARLPSERQRLQAERAKADPQAAHALRTSDGAEELFAVAERGRSEEGVAEARRAVIRTRDALRMAERHVSVLDEEAAELESAAAEAIREVAELEGRAHNLAAAFGEHSRLAEQAASEPGPGLGGVVEWGSAARAALFVARGGLSSEREAVIRQANELGSVLLGEPLLAARPAAVVRRVEELKAAGS
jgi:chromosome segregation ATPase